MADFGAIGIHRPLSVKHWVVGSSIKPSTFIGTFNLGRDPAPSFSGRGALAGTLTQGSANVQNRRVRLYHRPTGLLLAETRTLANGVFSFSGLKQDQANYYVIALDADAGEPINMAAQDRLAPEIVA